MLDTSHNNSNNNNKAALVSSLHQASTSSPSIAMAAAAKTTVITMPSRERFYVELKPGETTFVSWKKLLKEFQKSAMGSSSPPPEAPVGAHPALEARIAPEVVKDKDPLASPPNRFNSVIEKIERLYQGGDSDDEMDDFIDDDKYDTRDSFIDDTELDDYFSVEDAKLKHTGFYVNRGSLEQESVSPAIAIPKKRQRKEVKKVNVESNEGEVKQSKTSSKPKTAVRKTPMPSATLPVNSSIDINRKEKDVEALPRDTEKGSELVISKSNTTKFSKEATKEKRDGKHMQDVVAVDSSTVGNTDKANSKEQTKGSFDVNEPLERDSITPLDYKESPTINGTKAKTDSKEGSTKKLPLVSSKEVSPMRSKGTVLDRAILDLEKGVAELCPPSLVSRDLEQGKRNRLPREIKQKLAKVARLAAKQGRITEELIDRLMAILGHVMRVKTLKRNMKAMIEMGLSAMQEKEGRLQGIKNEVTEMIKSRVHDLQVQEVRPPDNVQLLVTPTEKQGEGRYQWDHATEDKICDLYEQYIEGVDENKGPHLRKLYAELSELWPDGWMDNNGIRLALHRAKERKKKLMKLTNSSSDSKKRRRPVVKPKMEELGPNGEMIPHLTASGSHDQSPVEKCSSAFEYEARLSHAHERQLMEDKKHVSKLVSSDKKNKTPDGSMPAKKKVKSQPENNGAAAAPDFSFCSLNKSSSTDDSFIGSTSVIKPASETPLWNVVTEQPTAPNSSMNE